MPFVRRTPKMSSRLFVWGSWVFLFAVLYLCASVLLSFAGKEWPGLFPNQAPEIVVAAPPAEPPPGSVLARPASILDQSVTRQNEGRDQVRRLLQEAGNP